MSTAEILRNELTGCEVLQGKLFTMISYKTAKDLTKITASMYVLGISADICKRNKTVTFRNV